MSEAVSTDRLTGLHDCLLSVRTLSLIEVFVLVTAKVQDKRLCTVRATAERFGCAKASITRSLDKLSLQGLLQREAVLLDNRSITFGLTAKGEEYMAIVDQSLCDGSQRGARSKN